MTYSFVISIIALITPIAGTEMIGGAALFFILGRYWLGPAIFLNGIVSLALLMWWIAKCTG
jgi:hypothetical protein